MKSLPVFIVGLVVSLGFGGCCIPPGPHAPQPPALTITPHPPQSPSIGNGTLDVRLNTHCLSSVVIKTATFTVDGCSHHFGKPISVKPGKHLLKFPSLVGFYTPPSFPVVVPSGGSVQVDVSYNLKIKFDKAHHANAPKAMAKAAPLTALSTVDGGVVLVNPANPNPTPTGSGTLVVTASQSSVNGHGWFSLGSGTKKLMNLTWPNLGVGNATINFFPVDIAGYLPPPPPSSTLIHIWKGQTTQVIVTYGQP